MSTRAEQELDFERALRDFGEAIESVAAAIGAIPDDVKRDLIAIASARCWKRIPRCFNGWGVGICARPGMHDGDCSPFPDMAKKGDS